MHELAKLGALGEDLALRHLKTLGFDLVERNFRSRRGEIDLIVSKNRAISFVEVKTRRGGKTGHPFEAITKTKMASIRSTAVEWLALRQVNAISVSFSAVAVSIPSRLGDAPLIEFLENIF